jgi:hypothetical protein
MNAQLIDRVYDAIRAEGELGATENELRLWLDRVNHLDLVEALYELQETGRIQVADRTRAGHLCYYVPEPECFTLHLTPELAHLVKQNTGDSVTETCLAWIRERAEEEEASVNLKMTVTERVDLIKRVAQWTSDHAGSWRVDNIGADLAYLLWAISDHTARNKEFVYLDPNSALFGILSINPNGLLERLLELGIVSTEPFKKSS